MIAGWVAILTALVYMCALFGVAHFGDTTGRVLFSGRLRPLIYALTLGVYCTSWTFFGSVGLASSSGLDFLPIYIGPALVLGLGAPFVLRIVRLAKSQNITSVADFVAARYGKSEPVAALVTVIVLIGVVPYISLQLKAVSATFTTVLGSLDSSQTLASGAGSGFQSLLVAGLLALFAMAFGTRHIEATEHQDGLVLAIAAESIIKLVAFTVVGIFVTWGMFDGLEDLASEALARPDLARMLAGMPDAGVWLTTTVLSACCIVLLPRQFHVMVVENRNENDVKTASWLFPLYLLAINIFVVPLAIAGRLTFPDGMINRDMTVLALPLEAHSGVVALVSMIGGLSAATAMVVVASVALSIMMSNDLLMPVILRGRGFERLTAAGDLGSLVLTIRRLSIVVVLALGWIYGRFAGDAALSAIGLLSFAAISQIAPGFLGGLFWKRANARGAMAGLLVGMGLWAYTLFLPSLDLQALGLESLVESGPLGIAALKPTALFGVHLPSLVHGAIWSLGANILAFAGFSLTRHPLPIERLQGSIFGRPEPAPMGQAFRLWRSSVSVREVEMTVARYLGADHTRREFTTFLAAQGSPDAWQDEADIQVLRFAEHLLASAIGAASSRLVLSTLLKRRNVSREAALRLVDEASAAFQYNRDLLQHALDFARQGITVFDRDLRLICWNREFRDLFDMPLDRLRVGTGLDEIIRFNAARGLYGPGASEHHVAGRMESLVNERVPFRLRLQPGQKVVEIRSAQMPDGGLVTTYTDVTDAVAAEEALAATNERLEQRVRERTEDLERLNAALEKARAEAEEANISKTRFLAAASHDILQPLNAARLYATSLVEQIGRRGAQAPPGDLELMNHLDASLESVEDILGALLDMSRLDAGAMKVEIGDCNIDDILSPLRIEFEPLAREKGLELVFVRSSASLRTDRRLLRRLLQNLISNAIKYTPAGRVLVGCRREGQGRLRVEVHDTGPGIPAAQHRIIFREFERLAPAAKSARGLGLGLSIVERLGRVLGHEIRLRSEPGRGSMFSVTVPIAAIASRRGPARTARAPTPVHEPLAGLSILAIDNEPRVLEGMRVLLAGWDCAVVTAASLEEAQASLSATGEPPDAIIADYHLDEGDGIAAIAQIRATWGTDLPAVLVTADRDAAMRDRAAQGDIRVLHKPLKPAALRALLAQWRITQRAAE